MRFQAIWGYKWTNSLSNNEAIAIAQAEWGQALSHLSGEEIKKGIEHCRANFKYPPSITEFLEHSQDSQKYDMEIYVRNMMQSTGWSEEETREYYRQKGYAC